MKVKILLFLSLIIFLFCANAQEETKSAVVPKLQWSVYGGGVAVHRLAMNHLGKKPYLGQEIKLGFQTTGIKYWQKTFNYPLYGIGVYSGYFFNEIIGNPMAVFTFIELPFKRKNNSHFSTGWATGLSFNQNEFDALKNPENIAIGSDLNVYIDFSFLYRKTINERMDIGAGIKLQHFSNGAVRQPNLGLNMISGQLVMSYLPGKVLNEFYEPEIKESVKNYEFTGMVAYGFRGDSEKGSETKYLNTTASMGVSKRLNYKRNLSAGLDVFYNEYLFSYYPDNVEVHNNDLFSLAGYLGSDLIVNKFRLAVQLGFYLYRPVEYHLPFYERVALRYYFIPQAFINASIKAHAAKAQNIEWGVGFCF